MYLGELENRVQNIYIGTYTVPIYVQNVWLQLYNITNVEIQLNSIISDRQKYVKPTSLIIIL